MSETTKSAASLSGRATPYAIPDPRGARDTSAMGLPRRPWSYRRRLRAERETERVFTMSPALLGIAGFDGYLRRVNPAFAIFGYSWDELVARPWIEFAHPDDRELMMRA